MRKSLFFTLMAFLLLGACKKKDFASEIAALEQAMKASPGGGKADSLITLYRDAVAAYPDSHADNLRYLSRAAELKFTRQKDAVTAVRWIDEALKKHAQGQNLTEPIGTLALIWHAYQYKASPELQKNPDEIDLMKAHLAKNMNWIDSTLVALDKAMGSPVVNDKAAADKFILIAEAYSTLVQAAPDKYADLLMKAAGLAKTIGDPNKAMQLYYKIGEQMPDHPKAPTALFMMAFIYENDLRDIEKAKATYELFLKRYPNDPDYADDAENALKYIGLSAEEIIKKFEKQQGQPQ